MNAIMMARFARLVKLKTSICTQRLHNMVETPDNALEHRNQAFSLAYVYQIREVGGMNYN